MCGFTKLLSNHVHVLRGKPAEEAKQLRNAPFIVASCSARGEGLCTRRRNRVQDHARRYISIRENNLCSKKKRKLTSVWTESGTHPKMDVDWTLFISVIICT